jgi:SpoVK/Ycf46/Vps4 family AAA+-type ATPase
MAVSSKAQDIPSFVRKVSASRHQPRIRQDPYKPLAAIYVLRLALGLNRQLSLQALAELFENSLGGMTGLVDVQVEGVNYPDPEAFSDRVLADSATKSNKTDLLKHMRKRLRQLISDGMCVNTPLFNNLQKIADHFSLNTTEQEVLAVRLLMDRYPCFRLFINEHFYRCTDTALQDYLCILTTRTIADIEKCLAPDGILRKLGILEVTAQTIDLEDKLRVPPNLLDILLLEYDSVEHLLNQFFIPSKPSILRLSDYANLQADLNIVLPYLQAALETRHTGVNLLIQGSAEHGKTELVRLLAQSLGASLFEVRRSVGEDISLMDHDRFAACKLTQVWLSNQSKPSLILIDDADEILPRRRPSQSLLMEEEDITNLIDKSWLDQQLEKNPVPTIWLVNKARNIDTAYLRRFDYSLLLDKAPIALRSQLINQATRDLNVSVDWRQQVAKRSDFSLAQITKAAAVAKISQTNSQASAEAIMQQVLNAGQRLLTQTPGLSPSNYSTGYNLMFTNTNIKLPEILAGLRRTQRGTFCFYGASGTGKSAFANHLAEQLGLPILIKRASDILGKYVGQSEHNIARMFNQAQKQGAILLLDEADSLLGDRRDARHQWEVSQVNEMLTQMERFNGIFICTTNLMEKLDVASLRRFDFKVKFDYLHTEQRWALFQQESQRLGANLPEDSQELFQLRQQIQRLTKLTPGDFTVLNRQATLLGTPLTLERMIAVLTQECLAKGETVSQIGFVH